MYEFVGQDSRAKIKEVLVEIETRMKGPPRTCSSQEEEARDNPSLGGANLHLARRLLRTVTTQCELDTRNQVEGTNVTQQGLKRKRERRVGENEAL